MSRKSNPPLASTRAELRNLRNNSQATVAELKAFLAEMKGRSPQEMLGMVSGNPLFRATVQSCVLLLVILAALTVVPYLTREKSTSKPAAEKQAPPPAEPATEAAAPGEPAAVAEPAPEAAETLGVGEEKQAPPEVNPLDADTGNFLDELE